MAYNSILDRYYNLIKKDADYYKKWLRQHGTECTLMIPKSESVQVVSDVQDAFGAQTFASTSLNYSESTMYILILTRDFSKIENGTESVIQAIVPEKMDDGYVIRFRRLNTWYDFVVDRPVETVYDMLYRVTLRLLVPKSEAKT